MAKQSLLDIALQEFGDVRAGFDIARAMGLRTESIHKSFSKNSIMARSQQSIQQEILERIASDERLKDLTSLSKAAIYRLMAYVVSYAIWLLEKLFDTHKEEVTNALYEQKSGSLRWYRQKALDFQYGFELLPGTDRFNDEGATAQEIAQSKIVKYAAVTESESESRLISRPSRKAFFRDLSSSSMRKICQ